MARFNPRPPINYRTGLPVPNYLLYPDGLMARVRGERKTPVYPVLNGHYRISICEQGKMQTFSLYKLLWVTFIGELREDERVYSLTGLPDVANLVTRKSPNHPILRLSWEGLENG